MMYTVICSAIGFILGALYADSRYRRRWEEFELSMMLLYKRAQILAGLRPDGKWR